MLVSSRVVRIVTAWLGFCALAKKNGLTLNMSSVLLKNEIKYLIKLLTKNYTIHLPIIHQQKDCKTVSSILPRYSSSEKAKSQK